jgi:hypothetical protein
MLDTYREEVEEQLADVVVCNKSSIEEMMRELEQRRSAARWIAVATGIFPEPQQNGISAEVLIHIREKNGSEAVTVARYLPNSRQWRVCGVELNADARVIGWKSLPKPEYGG